MIHAYQRNVAHFVFSWGSPYVWWICNEQNWDYSGEWNTASEWGTFWFDMHFWCHVSHKFLEHSGHMPWLSKKNILKKFSETSGSKSGWIDFVTDVYHSPSIKDSDQDRIGEEGAIHVRIMLPTWKCPKIKTLCITQLPVMKELMIIIKWACKKNGSIDWFSCRNNGLPCTDMLCTCDKQKFTNISQNYIDVYEDNSDGDGDA